MSTPAELLEALGREARARLGGERDRSPNVRVFRGRNVEELIPQIEAELGADALIVRRREGLTGGVLGFFQRAFVEIEAMPGGPRLDTYDDDQEESGPFVPDVPAPAPSGFEPPQAPPGQATVPPAAAARSYEAAVSAPPAPASQPPAPPLPAPPAPSAVPYAHEFQVRERGGGASPYVTAHLAALARYGPSAPPPAPPPAMRSSPSVDFQELLAPRRTSVEPLGMPPTPAPASAPATVESRTVAPGSHGRARAGVEKTLLRYGVSAEFAGELIDGASAHTLPLSPRAGLAQAVRSTLAQRIPVAALLPARGAAIVLVGPGGSGKTTFCAALLRAYRAGSTLPASYATLTRAAGPSQSNELRMILSPHVVKPALASSTRAQRALRRVRADGLGILDTPSLSPADRTGIRELARLLGEIKAERVVVALPATLGAAAADQLLEALAPLGAHALAVTHADETDQIGVAVEAACRHGLAPEYVLERRSAGPGEGWRVARVDPGELATRMLQ